MNHNKHVVEKIKDANHYTPHTRLVEKHKQHQEEEVHLVVIIINSDHRSLLLKHIYLVSLSLTHTGYDEKPDATGWGEMVEQAK